MQLSAHFLLVHTLFWAGLCVLNSCYNKSYLLLFEDYIAIVHFVLERPNSEISYWQYSVICSNIQTFKESMHDQNHVINVTNLSRVEKYISVLLMIFVNFYIDIWCLEIIMKFCYFLKVIKWDYLRFHFKVRKPEHDCYLHLFCIREWCYK